jgi:hypothetical protein
MSVVHSANQGRRGRRAAARLAQNDRLAKPPCERIEHEVDESTLLIKTPASCMTMLVAGRWHDYAAPPAPPTFVTSWK